MKKVFWITGASSGIGAELARQYAKRNVLIILSARRESLLIALKKELGNSKDIQLLPFDLIDFQMIPTLVEKAIAIFGRIDVLINNGGISQRSMISETSFEVYKTLMEVDYLGPVALSRALLPHFIKQQKGHYVVVSSVMGKFGSPYRSGYCGAKHALHGFFDVLRMEHSKDNIFVSMICPGFIQTNITINAITGDGSALGYDDPATRSGIPAPIFCRKMIRAIALKKRETIIAKKEKFGVYLRFFSNRLLQKIILNSKVR